MQACLSVDGRRGGSHRGSSNRSSSTQKLFNSEAASLICLIICIGAAGRPGLAAQPCFFFDRDPSVLSKGFAHKGLEHYVDESQHGKIPPAR